MISDSNRQENKFCCGDDCVIKKFPAVLVCLPLSTRAISATQRSQLISVGRCYIRWHEDATFCWLLVYTDAYQRRSVMRNTSQNAGGSRPENSSFRAFLSDVCPSSLSSVSRLGDVLTHSSGLEAGLSKEVGGADDRC